MHELHTSQSKIAAEKMEKDNDMSTSIEVTELG